MPVSQIMLELTEELADSSEAVLDDMIDDAIETEEEIELGLSDDDDKVIEFIDKGDRFTNSDPVDFTDDDVEDIAYFDDDDEEENV